MPTTIILFVHFDLVPGSHPNEEYISNMRSGFQAASGTAGTESGGASPLKASRSQIQTNTGIYDVQPSKAATLSQVDEHEKPGKSSDRVGSQ